MWARDPVTRWRGTNGGETLMKRRFLSFSRVSMVAASFAVAAGVVAVPSVSQAAGSMYYMSLGDSYSVGYQPLPTSGATTGYTGVVATSKHLTLENFGCGG